METSQIANLIIASWFILGYIGAVWVSYKEDKQLLVWDLVVSLGLSLAGWIIFFVVLIDSLNIDWEKFLNKKIL